MEGAAVRRRGIRAISGELENPTLEAAFRAWSHADHALRTRFALRAGAVVMAPFALVDLSYLGSTPTGLALAAARATWTAVALLFAARATETAPERLDRDTALSTVVAVAIVLAASSQRPSGFQPHTLTAAAVVLAVYQLMPLRFTAAAFIGFGFSLAYVAMSLRTMHLGGPLFAILGGFALVNVIGLTGHAWVARVGRSEFLRVREVEELHAERLAFLASTSHELRSPLHGIVACAELLAGTELDEEQRGLVGLIRSSCAAMAGLLEEAVLQVRGGHELPAIDPQRIDLHAFHDEVSAFVRARAATHGVVVDVERDDSVPRHVHADAGRLRQVLLNFAENALTHGAKSRIVLALSSNGRRDGRVSIRLEVRDDGPGVSSELRTEILQPFVHGRPSRGMGLGLSICDRIARAMGATLDIDDAPEGGACFRLTVPLLEATSGSAEAVAKAGPRRVVLLVEDEAVNRRLGTLLLERMGHEVVGAPSGEAALDALETRPFDVVLMDLRLPRIDGVETVRRLRARGLSVPVFALSAHAALADHDALRSAGFDAVLSKPLDVERLKTTLAELAAPTPTAATKSAIGLIDESKLAMHVEVLGRTEVVRLIQMFLETTGPTLDAIGLAADGGRWLDVASLAHRLAGACDAIALPACSEEASRIEKLARTGGPVPLEEVHALRGRYEDSVARLNSW